MIISEQANIFPAAKFKTVDQLQALHNLLAVSTDAIARVARWRCVLGKAVTAIEV